MLLYLDTSDAGAIAEFLATGLFAGVTSNPVILRAAGLGPHQAGEFYDRCREAGAGQIFIQTFGYSVSELVEQGCRYRAFGPEVVVKVVASRTGAAAAAALRGRDVPVLLTAVHSSKQVLGAMAAHASYVTPYLSEMNRAGRDGLAEISTMQRVLTAANTSTRLLLAGVDEVETVVRFAGEGVEHATLTPTLAESLLDDELTTAMEVMFNDVSALLPS